jgi:hypothetical protein
MARTATQSIRHPHEKTHRPPALRTNTLNATKCNILEDVFDEKFSGVAKRRRQHDGVGHHAMTSRSTGPCLEASSSPRCRPRATVRRRGSPGAVHFRPRAGGPNAINPKGVWGKDSLKPTSRRRSRPSLRLSDGGQNLSNGIGGPTLFLSIVHRPEPGPTNRPVSRLAKSPFFHGER